MSTSPQQSYNRYKKYSTDLRHYFRLPAVQTSLTVVLSLFITAFFILVALRPTFVTITKLNKNIEESEKVLKQLQTKAMSLQKVAQLWEQALPLTKYLESSIPSKGPEYKLLVQTMEQLAVETGVVLVSETVGESLTFSKIADPYSGNNRSVIGMPFIIRVSGSYAQIAEFLEQLTTIDRLISIESMSLAKDAELEGGRIGVSLSLSGKTHYLADEGQLATILGKVVEGAE